MLHTTEKYHSVWSEKCAVVKFTNCAQLRKSAQFVRLGTKVAAPAQSAQLRSVDTARKCAATLVSTHDKGEQRTKRLKRILLKSTAKS